jgi:hypothetical protein
MKTTININDTVVTPRTNQYPTVLDAENGQMAAGAMCPVCGKWYTSGLYDLGERVPERAFAMVIDDSHQCCMGFCA